MSWCHNCGAEYRPGFTSCSDCDLPLHDEPPPPPPVIDEVDAGQEVHDHPNMDVRTAYLGSFGKFEAEIVLDILRDAGIFAFNKHALTEPDRHAYSPLLESESGRILVDAARLDEARALIERQLPEHMRSIEAAMLTIEEPLE